MKLKFNLFTASIFTASLIPGQASIHQASFVHKPRTSPAIEQAVIQNILYPVKPHAHASVTAATTGKPTTAAAQAVITGHAAPPPPPSQAPDDNTAPKTKTIAASSLATTPNPSKDTNSAITVHVGKSIVVDMRRPVKRIAVGLGEYAEASAVSPTEVLINGKAAGETSLILWDVAGTRQFIRLSVVADTTVADDHLDSVRRELRSELPDQPLVVSSGNGSVFLRGTVKDINSSDRAVQIASTAGKVVNLLYVQVPASDPQVLLKVRFASVDRSLSKQLGINLFSTGYGNVIGGVNTGQFSPPSLSLPTDGTPSTASISNELNMFAFFPGLNLGATIEAMESKGLVQVLAEPNLLAMNGKKASFLAGGEYPYPIVQGTASGSAAVTISFKEYGVRLSFIPTVTPRGTIHMQLSSEVSSLDFTNAVEVSGFQVPAIDTRNVKTEIELGEGQSFAVGGLLDNRETQTFQKVPFLGSIPILGKFFQSISKTKSNTELIIIVTPEIVAPIPAGSPLPQLTFPEKFMAPNSGIPMHTPDSPPGTPAPTPPTMPVEELIQSMKPQKQLGDEGTSSSTTTTFGGGADTGKPN